MLAWGKKVSPAFRARLYLLAQNIKTDPNHLMACMAFETGETFNPAVRNAAGSGAVGLIQFMPATAMGLRTSSEQLAAMTAVKQLDFVGKYFMPKKGKLKSLEDVYMTILWPAAVGRANDYVLFENADPVRAKRYIQNAGLNFNKDGLVTKAEAAAKVRAKLAKSLQPAFAHPDRGRCDVRMP